MRFSDEDIDIESVRRGLLQPTYDLLDRGGKRWRPIMGMLYAELYGQNIRDFKESETLYKLLGSAELIHNATLMCDDIEDGSLLRRGEPCTYLKYGVDVGLNTGNALYFFPLNLMRTIFTDPVKYAAIMQIFIEEMSVVHFGQNWDICWHRGMHLPTETQYL